MSAAEVAGTVSLCAVGVTCGALGYLHVAPTGLSPVRNPVSQYGITPYRAWYRVQTVATGVAGAGAALAINEALSGPGVGTVVALVAIFAACRLVISWFPMDAPGAARTTTGALHGLLALVTFGCVGVAGLRLARVLDGAGGQHGLAVASRSLGWAMVGLAALLFLSRLGPDLRRAFGAIERGEYAAVIGWLVVIATAAVTGHLDPSSAHPCACAASGHLVDPVTAHPCAWRRCAR